MEIEKKIHTIENDPKYREMKTNLKTLETNPVGSRHVRIGTPENLKSMVELRRNSVEMDDLINRYRIEAAKKILISAESGKKNIMEIMYECGFYSKSVFNTAFKKFTAMTPSEFKKKNS